MALRSYPQTGPVSLISLAPAIPQQLPVPSQVPVCACIVIIEYLLFLKDFVSPHGTPFLYSTSKTLPSLGSTWFEGFSISYWTYYLTNRSVQLSILPISFQSFAILKYYLEMKILN